MKQTKSFSSQRLHPRAKKNHRENGHCTPQKKKIPKILRVRKAEKMEENGSCMIRIKKSLTKSENYENWLDRKKNKFAIREKRRKNKKFTKEIGKEKTWLDKNSSYLY